MSVQRITFAALTLSRNQRLTIFQVRSIVNKSGTGRRVIKSSTAKKSTNDNQIIPPPPAAADPWVEVLDKASGQVYFWNQTTNETTSLGAPKPTALNNSVSNQVAPQQSMASGLGGMVVQGFALGVGSSIGHSVMGSMFGGSSSGSSGSDVSGDGGSFDM